MLLRRIWLYVAVLSMILDSFERPPSLLPNLVPRPTYVGEESGAETNFFKEGGCG